MSHHQVSHCSPLKRGKAPETSAYMDMNGHLRYVNTASASTKKAIEDAQSGLTKGRAPADMEVTRFIHADVNKFFKEGKYYQDKGFVSTSIGAKPGFGGVKLTIRVFKGAPGAYVAPMSLHSQEKEFLIPHGAKFKVVSVQDNNVVLEYKGTSFKKKKKSAEEAFMGLQKKANNDDWDNYTPDDEFDIAPDRMGKFTWEEGDLIELDDSEVEDEENDNADDQEESTQKRRPRRLRLEKLDD